MHVGRWIRGSGAVGAALLALAAAAPLASAVSVPGPVASWGRNDQGQLGNGGTSNSSTPGLTSFLLDATDIAAGGAGGSAVTLGGTAYAWGGGSTSPQLVGAWPAIKVVGDKSRGDVLLADGQVDEWGADCCSFGPSISSPQSIAVSGITAIGIDAAIRADGTVWIWGFRGGDYPNPVSQVPGISNAIALDPNGLYALLSNGTVVLLPGSQTATARPVQGLSNVVSLSGDLALERDGTVEQLSGSSAFQVAKIPGAVAVSGYAASDDCVINQVTDLCDPLIKGGEFGFVLKSDGSLWAAGNNAFGQLGDGNTTSTSNPVQVNTLGLPVSAVSAGDGFGVATVGLPVTQWFNQVTSALGIGIRLQGDSFRAATVARQGRTGVHVARFALNVRISKNGRFSFTVDHGRIAVSGHVTKSRHLVGTIRFGSHTARFDTTRNG